MTLETGTTKVSHVIYQRVHSRKSQDFHDLRVHECSHVTRVDIPGTTQDFKRRLDKGASQDMFEYVRNTLTSDGSPRYLSHFKLTCMALKIKKSNVAYHMYTS